MYRLRSAVPRALCAGLLLLAPIAAQSLEGPVAPPTTAIARHDDLPELAHAMSPAGASMAAVRAPLHTAPSDAGQQYGT